MSTHQPFFPKATQAIDHLTQQYTEELLFIRRELHKIPEPGFKEVKTSSFIHEYLTKYNVEITTGIAGTGITALLDTGSAGPTILMRADMDALPIQESNNNSYASRHTGYMHACGHDAHMAIVLMAVKIFDKIRKDIRGRILFVFQPAEEGGGGAKLMTETGIVEKHDVSCCIAAHIWPTLPSGQIGIRTGPTMAAMDQFEITITGRGGHAAKPHETIDTLDTGVQVINALQRVVSRQVDPLVPAVLTVASFHAGEAFNIIPDTATIRGTLRTFETELRNSWEEKLHKVIHGICESTGATYKLDYQSRYPPVINDSHICRLVRRAALSIVGEENTIDIEPTLGSEDVSFFFERAPGCFFFIGADKNAEQGSGRLHSPHFILDEQVLPTGLRVMCHSACELLSK